MQDKLLKMLGSITSGLEPFQSMEQEFAPILLELKQNSDKVDPKLMAVMDAEEKKLSSMYAELELLKEKLRNEH
jgi:hypothetical protein